MLAQHLDSLGIDHRSLTTSSDYQRLDRQLRLYRLATFAFRATGDELLGLKIGRKVPLNGYGALAHAILSAPTLLHALQIIVKHMRIFQTYPRNAASLGNARGRVYLTYNHPVRLDGFPNFVSDLFFATDLQILRHLGGDLKGFRLELAYSPSNHRAFVREIGIPVEFNRSCNRLSAPAEAMNRPLPGTFFSHSPAYRRLTDNLLANIKADERLIDRIAEMIAFARNKTIRAPDVAKFLNISERSLRRKLQQSGVNFTNLVGELRAELARAYLAEMPVRDVAELLGYHDPSTFRRAFRRWTGITPHDYIAISQNERPADRRTTSKRNRA
ncbi:MAG: AraC family transcriptional regulator ligand-binding domain-containing protein [Xanthobacteraceae bacterium]